MDELIQEVLTKLNTILGAANFEYNYGHAYSHSLDLTQRLIRIEIKLDQLLSEREVDYGDGE